MTKSEKLPSSSHEKTPLRDDFSPMPLSYLSAPSHHIDLRLDFGSEITAYSESAEDIRHRYPISEEKEKSSYIVPINKSTVFHGSNSQSDKSLYFHPIVHGSSGLLAAASAYGRGLVSSVRFYMTWKLFEIMLGQRLVEFTVPVSFAATSFFIAPLLAVDWGVNGYHSSLMLVNAYKEKRKKTRSQNPVEIVSNVLRQNTLAILLGLIGAIGHSFVVHHSVLELGKAYGEHSAMAPVFNILHWFFPVVCGLQYLSTEVSHTAESLKRPLIFEDYSEGMILKENGEYRKMTRVERGWRITSMNLAAIVTSLAWGTLECNETYLSLRRHLNRNGVALSNEIALLVGLFFGLLGAYNTFVADGERFKCFVTHPYREPVRDIKNNKKPILNLPPRKIPHFSRMFYSSKLPLKLLSTGLLSVMSSAGLGVVGATGPLQMINVFVQFYDPEKPLYASWWLMAIAGGVGATTAAVFWVSKGRYIYSRWRHSDAEKQLWTQEEWVKHYRDYQDHRETGQDKESAQQRNLLKEPKPYYDIHHGALDVLQIGTIFFLKLFVELQWDLRLPFLSEISTVYLTTLAVGLIPFGCEEVSGARKPMGMDKAKNIQTLRRVMQCFAQIIIPFAVGVTSEWILHSWVMKEPASEESRLTFAHITGTFIAAVSATVTKRMVDVMFSKPETYLKWAFFEPPLSEMSRHPLINQTTEYGQYYHYRNFALFHLFRKINRINEVPLKPLVGLQNPNGLNNNILGPW